LKPGNANIVAFVPIIGEMKFIKDINLFLRAIEQVRECKYVKDIVAVSEKDSNLEFACEHGIKGIKRDLDLLGKESTLENTLNYSLREYEKENDIVDAIIFINYLFPFRPEGFFSNLIENYAYTGSDNTIAALKDYRIYWVNEGDEYRAIGNNFKQRSEKTPIFQGLFGLGSIISANFVRKGVLLGENIELIDVMDTKYRLKVSDTNSEEIAGFLLEQERKKKQKG
jgi:CMP-N-acetylneuraminic acid synthetase